MKIDVKYIVPALFAFVLGLVSGILVQEYAVWKHEHIKTAEKEALKEKIVRENQILIGRLEEDFEVFKDSVTVAFSKKKKKHIREHGLLSPGSSALKSAVEARIDGENNRVVAERRKQVDRKIEDLEMRLDF